MTWKWLPDSMRDLDIRGAGNMLGGEQAALLLRSVLKVPEHRMKLFANLKRTEFKELFKEEIHKQDDFVSDWYYLFTDWKFNSR